MVDFFSRSSVEDNLDCFQVSDTMNKAAMNIIDQVHFWEGRAPFGYIPGSGIDSS